MSPETEDRGWAAAHVGHVVVLGGEAWDIRATSGPHVLLRSADDASARLESAETVRRAYMTENAAADAADQRGRTSTWRQL